MTELICDIVEITTKSENEYFVVYSIEEDKTYIIPTHQLLKHNIEVGERHIFQKVQHINSKQYFLNYVCPEKNENQFISHKYYNCNEIYEFKIIKFDKQINKKGETISIISVEDIDKNIITVLGLKWHNEEIWKFETLKCEVRRILKNGTPDLINKDFRHPFYQVGEEYEFKIVGEKIKETDSGQFNVFELTGEDGCIHEVKMFPSQKSAPNKLETVQCKIISITTHLRLVQTNVKDPFFVTFEKITNKKCLEKKYFSRLFNEVDKTNKDVLKLIEQYNTQRAFWVFTFTDKILLKLFRECIDRQNYKQAMEINELIIIFEEWIIKKGIIKSFPDVEIRERTKNKAKGQLESANIFDSVLQILNTNPIDFLKDNMFFSNKKDLLARFSYLIRSSNIELLDCNLFIFRLQELFEFTGANSESDLFYLKLLLNYISFNKKMFISEKEKEYFSLSSYKIGTIKFTENETKYLIWTYGEILIAKKLSMKEHVNILCGQLLKLFTKSTFEVDEKECILFNAYRYFENFQSSELQIPFHFDSYLSINFDVIDSNILNAKFSNENWEELENSFANNIPFAVQLTKKSKTGYEVNCNNLKGFLPYHLIKDIKLRNYPFEEADFTINAKCLSISRSFNFFIIEQINNPDFSTGCKNNILFIEDSIYNAIIKRIENYGMFLSTNAGEGLLHIDEIFDFSWNHSNLNKYFEVGGKIKVVLRQLTKDGKAIFNFYMIKDRDLLYYNEYVERVFSDHTNVFYEATKELEPDTNFDIAQNEKAFCIEQFAVLQSDINKKLQNFQIAQQFYTNAKNARSFLINIYISYFEILLRIKETLQNRALENISDIKKNAQKIKNKINQKTIETFPDSDKLIFFLEIVSMFNEKSETIQETLFEYIKKYNSESTRKDLKTIAKITLANNLLISESKEDSDFSLKNLRLIFDYLSNGILSLEETIEDKNAREVKEDILDWKEKIKEDESEILEFKSSFFTPILNEKEQQRLEILKKLEKQTEQSRAEISKINGDLAKKAVIHSSLKTLVAFANTSGGTLLIGVDDNKKIIGLEQEYLTFSKKQGQNRDGFGKNFDDTVRNYIGDSFSSLMNRRFLKFPEGDVLIVKIESSVTSQLI